MGPFTVLKQLASDLRERGVTEEGSHNYIKETSWVQFQKGSRE